MTPASYTVTTNSSQATEAVAEQIGANLKGGETIELVSDLGGGKTTFVRGLARGAGSSDRVASPTFTISKVYQAGQLELHHFDFYRLSEGGIVARELAEVINDPKVVVIVEWGGVVESVLPIQRLQIQIRQTGETERQLTIVCPPELSYIMKGVGL